MRYGVYFSMVKTYVVDGKEIEMGWMIDLAKYLGKSRKTLDLWHSKRLLPIVYQGANKYYLYPTVCFPDLKAVTDLYTGRKGHRIDTQPFREAMLEVFTKHGFQGSWK